MNAGKPGSRFNEASKKFEGILDTFTCPGPSRSKALNPEVYTASRLATVGMAEGAYFSSGCVLAP